MLFILFSNTASNYKRLVATYAGFVNYLLGYYEKDTVNGKADE